MCVRAMWLVDIVVTTTAAAAAVLLLLAHGLGCPYISIPRN